ncbi:MAG: alpha/beta hydrolase [Bacteroidota bacterium]
MRSSVLLLAALALSLPVAASAQTVPSGLSGTWSGAAITDGIPTLFSLDIEVIGDSLATTLTQPYNGYETFGYAFAYTPPEADQPGDGFLTSGLYGDMRLLVDLQEQNLRGTVSEEDSVVATVFLQRVIPFGLPRFDSREFRVVSGRDTLAGALFTPGEPEFRGGPHPTVVLVTGRGYGGRWEMTWLARLYARNGIAAVVWDGRGQGRSTGDRTTVTSAQRFADVNAILDWSREQPEVDAEQIGVQGNSAGGWIGPLAIQDRDDVAFLVTTVGPAESLADQQAHTTTQLMEDSGTTYTDAEYQAAFEYQRSLVPMAQRGATWEEYEAVNAAAREARWAEHALIPDSLGLPDLDYYARMPGLDPAPALAEWNQPFLAVLGSEDWIVPPEHNVELMETLLADNPDATITVLNMGHALERPEAVVGEGEWPFRYRRDWTRVPELYTTLLGWLDARTTTVAEREAGG